jgi:aryl-alcohol dehydrogenase-like predicted oxidoreductase
METRAIGSLTVSLVGLGCNNFGMRTDEERSTAVVHAAIDAGITFFDTADVYGGTRSEEILGKALAGRRDEVVIATKFGAPIADDPERCGAGARWITQAVEDSLTRLGTDRIDLYQQHLPDTSVPIEETLEALDALVRAGKVREIGNSNFSGDQIDEAATTSAAHGWARFASAQNQLSLVARGPLKEVIPACARNDLAFLPYFPLASGLLTGKYRRGEAPARGTRLSMMPEDRVSQVLTDANFERVERLSAWAAQRGRTILELAFAWLVVQPTMASVIAGATSPEQVRANAAAVEWRLGPDDLAEIDDVIAAAKST